jgi:gluconolactonase
MRHFIVVASFSTAVATVALAAQGPAVPQTPAPASAPAAQANQPAQPPLVPSVAKEIRGVITDGTAIKPIGDGFQGTEGPIRMPDGTLIFTETQANRITRIDHADNKSTFLDNTNGSNALAWDKEGRLYSVQTTPGSMKVGIIYPKGSERVLADGYEGKPFLRPNDLVLSTTGGIYFTDFPLNATPGAGSLTPAVYYIPPGGRVMRVADNIERPNGVTLSRDEKTLYVNNSYGEYMLAFDVQADGRLTNRRNFAKYNGVQKPAQGPVVSNADGLAIDSEGRLYAAMPDGVQVFSPFGDYLGLIPTSRRVQNLAFAGAEKKVLYMVGSGSAWKTYMYSSGFAGRAK